MSRIAWGNGRCDFAVNRRTNREGDVPKLQAAAGSLQGPDDHDVPVLRVARPDGSLTAVVFGYACHCTVLDFYKFCGDYAGFAQVELESRYPGATAMFVAGCGGDQNPIPRRSSSWPRATASSSARAWRASWPAPMQPVDGPMQTAYEEIPLAFASLPTREQLERDTHSDNFYIASRARHLLKNDRGPRSSRTGLSLSGPGLAARRPDLDLPRRRGRRRLFAAAQAQPRLLAHLGLGLLQRRDGLYPLEAGPEGRGLRGSHRDDLLRPALAVGGAGGGIDHRCGRQGVERGQAGASGWIERPPLSRWLETRLSMKIFFVTRFCYLDDSNGAAFSSREIIEALARHGFAVAVLSTTALDLDIEVNPAVYFAERGWHLDDFSGQSLSFGALVP